MTTLYLVRHGQTEWSQTGKHTSFTDLPLTEHGRKEASSLKDVIHPDDFDLILASPRRRAQETAQLAGFDDFQVNEDLAEWNYGDYEGKTRQDIQVDVPDWQIWTHGAPNGESQDEVRERLRRVVATVRSSGADKAVVFAHGHSLRALATVWLDLPTSFGASLPLDTASISVLGTYHDRPAILKWNVPPEA